MKAAQIKVGGHYTARVSGHFVTVRVDGIRTVEKSRGTSYSGTTKYADVTVYDITDLRTGKHLTFQSAQKFRQPTSTPGNGADKLVAVSADADLPTEGEQGADFTDSPRPQPDTQPTCSAPTSTAPATPASHTDESPASAEGKDNPPFSSAQVAAESFSTVSQETALAAVEELPAPAVTSAPLASASAPSMSLSAKIAGAVATARQLTDEQRAIIDAAPGTQVLVIEAGAGCLAGDTIINVNRAGRGFESTIERLVMQFNGIQPTYVRSDNGATAKSRPWDLTIPTRIARAMGEVIMLGTIKRAWCSGEKLTYTIETVSGRAIRATSDHPFLLADGTWVKLQDLKVGSIIQVNSGRGKPEGSSGANKQYQSIDTDYHPFQVHRGGGRYSVAAHRLVVESVLNDLPFYDYVYYLRSDRRKSGGFQYLQPNQIVHHKNEDPTDNRVHNLEVLESTKEHSDRHSWGNNVLWQVGQDEIALIEEFGVEAVYDIEMVSDPHNFMANGFVVHNCGKTSTLVELANAVPGIGQYTAFNASLVTESKTKFPRRVNCNTIHSLAFAAEGRKHAHRLGGRRVMSSEVAAMIGLKDLPIMGAGGEPKILNAGTLAAQVTKAVRNFCQSAAREVGIEHVPRLVGIDAEGSRAASDAVKAYLLPFARKMWDDKCSPDGKLPFNHDDYVKCQPTGTSIYLYNSAGTVFSKQVPIEDIKIGDKVLAVPEHSKGRMPCNVVTKTSRLSYSGELIVVDTDNGLHSEYTPNHICVARVGDALENKMVVYLMKRGSSYRVGRARWQLGPQHKALGIVVRATMNDAEAVWVLSVHDSDADAALAEALTQHRFSIPGWQFVSPNELMPLERFWAEVGNNEDAARACAVAFGRDLLYPMWVVGQRRNWNRSAVEVRACNLISGMRFFDANQVHGSSKRTEVWRQGTISRVPFTGVVCSLEVDGNNTYIADGIGTHNCWELSGPVIGADYLLIDEAQDLSPVMLSIGEQNIKKGMRVILVGDSAQSIYGWRGSVNALAAFPDAPRLMLSMSFRFGPVIAEVANGILKHLMYPTPLVMRGFDRIASRVGEVDKPAAILCRTNAGAVGHLLEGVVQGRRPHMIGKQDDVISFIRAARDLQAGKTTQHPELCCFTSWREVEAYAKTEDGDDLNQMVKLIKGFGAEKILKAMETMPDEKDADVVISTAHKSKGREWQTIKLAGDFKPLEKMGDEEVRLLYVAATRAQGTLDVETCPPFCGGRNDAYDDGRCATVNISKARQMSREMDILPVPISGPFTATYNGVPLGTTEPAKATEAKPTPNGNTWAKGRNGDWLVRGKVGQTGEVDVFKKDGTIRRETIKGIVWQNTEVALYRV